MLVYRFSRNPARLAHPIELDGHEAVTIETTTMKELQLYYVARLKYLFVLLLAATAGLGQLHEELMKSGAHHWATTVTSFASHRFVLVAAIVLGEITIRKWLWRVEKPHLDFSGRWEGGTVYTKQWLDGPQVTLPQSAPHELDIRQDCLSIAVVPTTADAFTQWRSTVCDLLPDGALGYAYEVTYTERPGFPERARGYEVLQVVKKRARERPEAVAGAFHQVVSTDMPVFSGTVNFNRRPKKGRKLRDVLRAPQQILTQVRRTQ
jgi:hypothetical protein